MTVQVAFPLPGDRLSSETIERSARGVDEITYTCGTCASANRISFVTLDGLVQATLHAAMSGAAIDDEPARAFERLRPAAPGQRILECACVACGRRYRLVCEGGELSREGALDYRIVGVGEMARVRQGGVWWARGIAWLIVVGIVLGAVAVGRSGVEAERDRVQLIEAGRTVEAGIISESKRRRAPATLRIAYPIGDARVEIGSMTLPLLSGWHMGDDSIRVRYAVNEIDLVQPASTYERHAWSQWLGVVLLLVPAVLLARGLIRIQWAGRRGRSVS